MPELPEVETVRRVLKKDLIGLKINNVEIRYPNIISNEINEFLDNVLGKTIIDINRYGKYLIIVLNEGYILSHLRMEGKYFYLEEGICDNKHVHVIYHLSNGYMLEYQDTRKFGRMLYLASDIYNQEPLVSMGYDLVSSEINKDIVFEKIKRKRLPIKSILLDQSILAGLGNIYVDEVLFKSKINPLKQGNEITLNDVSNIILNSKEILNLAIENKGTTIRSYTSSLGVEGNYQNFLQVHTKSICPNCKMPLNRVKIGGRMTYYCDNCQR